MTIPTSAFPVHPQPAYVPASLQTDVEGTPSAGDFAELLTALLTTGRELGDRRLPQSEQREEQARRAAELTPLPGTPAEAFSAARLLVDLALDFPASDGEAQRMAALREAREIGGPPPLSPPEPVSAAAAAAAIRLTEQPDCPIAVASPFPDPSGARAAPAFASGHTPAGQSIEPSRIPARALSQTTFPQAAPSTPAAAAPSRTSAPRIAAPSVSTSTPRPASAPDPAPGMPSGRTSPYGAQLVAVEGGLKLVLRLPKLAEGERHGVEAALSRLLESHGHRRTAIVIHEIAEG